MGRMGNKYLEDVPIFALITVMLMVPILLSLFSTMPASADPGTWFIKTVDNAGDVGWHTSIALDDNNRPHISYYDDTNRDLKYARWIGSAWQIEIVDNVGIVGSYTSIALDDNGRPHISYYDLTNDDLKYARWDGSAWQKETVDSGGYAGLYTSIALDDNDWPHISYWDGYYNVYDLKYARWDGSAWQIETVDSGGYVGLYTSIALDDNNRPHISYERFKFSDGGADLKYARWDGSAWQKETVDSGGDAGLYTSIALDDNDWPHISYYDETNDDLKYARWDGSAWQIETVDSGGNVGSHTSIALDDSNRPHISYYDETNDDLKYARWIGSAWQIETVDSGGYVGLYTSIALDDNDWPHISYYDETNDDLKYATLLTIYSVRVSISPSYGENVLGGRLIYTIIVQNTSPFPDNYNLTINDDFAWDLTLSENRLEDIQPSENVQVTLNVTIPWDALPGTVDNIRIKATSQADSRASDEDSCIAYLILMELENTHPTADAYVSSNLPNWNFGGGTLLIAGRLSSTDLERAFLKFDLSAIPKGSIIDNAVLYLYSTDGSYVGPNIQCRRVGDDKWGEMGITWNNQPTMGEVLDNQNIAVYGQWYTWTVTDFVREQHENENDNAVSFCMVNATEDLVDRYAYFSSKEYDGYDPYLEITYRRGPHSVFVTISPSYVSGYPRRTISYSVTVKNVGWDTSSYRLENLDTLGWPMTLDNDRFDNIPPGENGTTTLRVTIPRYTDPCTGDNITVRVTSLENADVIASATCVAHAAESREVEVLISPDNQVGLLGSMLTYTMTVTNMGNVTDNYILTAVDDVTPSWGPTLADNLLENVAPGEDRTTTLTVTIPSDAENGAEDNVTVTATSQVDPSVSDNDSCIARAVITVVREVSVSISPGEDNAAPGENVEFTVTVTNTGNVTDTYTLENTDTEGWTLSIPPTVGPLAPDESTNVTLEVTIPSDAESGDSTTVTVTATSQTDNAVSASDTCTAIAEAKEGVIPQGPPQGPPIVPITVGVAAVGGGIAIALLLKRRIHLLPARSFLRFQSS